MILSVANVLDLKIWPMGNQLCGKFVIRKNVIYLHLVVVRYMFAWALVTKVISVYCFSLHRDGWRLSPGLHVSFDCRSIYAYFVARKFENGAIEHQIPHRNIVARSERRKRKNSTGGKCVCVWDYESCLMDIATDRGSGERWATSHQPANNTGLTTCRCYCFIITIKYRYVSIFCVRARQFALCICAQWQHRLLLLLLIYYGILNAILAIFRRIYYIIAYTIIVGDSISRRVQCVVYRTLSLTLSLALPLTRRYTQF